MANYQHLISGVFVTRKGAEVALEGLVRHGIARRQLALYANGHAGLKRPASIGSDGSLKNILVVAAIGTVVGLVLGAIGEIAIAAINDTLLMAIPLIAPLAMLGWGAGIGAGIGLVVGAVRDKIKRRKLCNRVSATLQTDQVLLVVKTLSEQETRIAIEVIQLAVGSYKDEPLR
jgi:hypothetical protein